MRRAAAPLAVLFAVLFAAAAAADPAERAAEMLERAEASLAAARTPAERLSALGRAAQAQEAALRALRRDLRNFSGRSAAIGGGLQAQERRLAAVLAALLRIERTPRLAALAHPGGAVAAARAGMMLAGFTPAMEREAARLRVALDEIEALRARRDAAAEEARASLAGLQTARAEISRLLHQNRRLADLPQTLLDRMAAEGAALARGADTLTALAAGAPKGPEIAGPSFTAARGALAPPVEGAVTRRFGEDGADGLEIAAPAYAEIYAPWRSVVRFAGPFEGHGVVVMLEPEPGALIVFAGLAEAFPAAGEIVPAGAPVGALGGPAPAADEFLIAATTGREAKGEETLYMELRQDGAPVDPASWFAFDNDERQDP